MTVPDTWTVDRVESGVAVIQRDDGGRVVELPLSDLPAGTREESVLRVPTVEGRPDWAAAELDEEERQARHDTAEGILARLRQRDPGGDLKL